MDFSLNYLNLLPDEMLLKVLIETDDLKTLSKWCQTSKRVNRICQDKELWKRKYRKKYGLSGEETLMIGDTWKQRYERRVSFGINSPISAGFNHYGVIDQEGNLYMVGSNGWGQLGIGDILSSDTPILVKFPQKIQEVISISAGFRVTGAVTKDRKAYIWGSDNSGFLFADQDEIRLPKELKLPRAGKAIKMEVDVTGYIVLLEDSSIYYSLVKSVNDRRLIKNHLKLEAIDVSISSNPGALSFITKNHKLYMLGSLSDFGFPDRLIHHRPVHILLPEPVVKVSMGLVHVMVLSTTGKVYTWGKNSYGQLGLGNKNAEIKSKLVKLPETIVQIEAKGHTSAALSDTGRLYIWGDNCMCGIGDQGEIFLSPVEISFGVPINFVSIGSFSIIAVSSDGVVNKFVSKGASE